MRWASRPPHQPPANYKKLVDRRQREQWPKEAANWPTDVEGGAIALYAPAAPAAEVRRREGGSGSSGGAPSAEGWGAALNQSAGGVNSYYMVLALRPMPGSTLGQWVGDNGWILWCIQQVAEVLAGTRMVGWVHRSEVPA
ncbi:MAG: hypothetical protein GY772_13230, partial [bacterium]|nr:hypothetical protein [bacterium]